METPSRCPLLLAGQTLEAGEALGEAEEGRGEVSHPTGTFITVCVCVRVLRWHSQSTCPPLGGSNLERCSRFCLNVYTNNIGRV